MACVPSKGSAWWAIDGACTTGEAPAHPPCPGLLRMAPYLGRPRQHALKQGPPLCACLLDACIGSVGAGPMRTTFSADTKYQRRSQVSAQITNISADHKFHRRYQVSPQIQHSERRLERRASGARGTARTARLGGWRASAAPTWRGVKRVRQHVEDVHAGAVDATYCQLTHLLQGAACAGQRAGGGDVKDN